MEYREKVQMLEKQEAEQWKGVVNANADLDRARKIERPKTVIERFVKTAQVARYGHVRAQDAIMRTHTEHLEGLVRF